MTPPDPASRVEAGKMIRAERKRRELSVEAAAKQGGIGHMTWRKIETGKSVHDQTLYAVDRTFEWEFGRACDMIYGRREPAGDVPPEALRTLDSLISSVAPTTTSTPQLTTTLSQLHTLSLAELRTTCYAAEHLIRHHETLLHKVSKTIEKAPSIALNSDTDRDEFTTSNLRIWTLYVRKHEELVTLKNELHDLSGKPVSAMHNLSHLLMQAERTVEQLYDLERELSAPSADNETSSTEH